MVCANILPAAPMAACPSAMAQAATAVFVAAGMAGAMVPVIAAEVVTANLLE